MEDTEDSAIKRLGATKPNAAKSLVTRIDFSGRTASRTQQHLTAGDAGVCSDLGG